MTADEFIAAMLAAPEKLAESLDDSMKECAPLVYSDLEDNFLGAKNPDGQAWPARVDPKPTNPLLILSGQLSEAATSPNAPASICRVENGELTIGVDKDAGGGGVPGAGVHNYGFPGMNIAQREFLGLSEESAGECDDILLRNGEREIFRDVDGGGEGSLVPA